jgi:hypothetical protein
MTCENPRKTATGAMLPESVRFMCSYVSDWALSRMRTPDHSARAGTAEDCA